MSPQISGLISSRERGLRYSLIACSLVVAIILILISVKVSAAPIWSGVAPSKETVNRALKGDRLPLVLTSDPSPADGSIEVHVPAPCGSAQFARWLRGVGQPSRAVCNSAYCRALRVLDERRKSARQLVRCAKRRAHEPPSGASANLRHIKKASSTWCFLNIQRGRSAATSASKPMTSQKELSSKGLVVVVIGDDPAVRSSLKFWLELEGLTVRSYASGEELLAADELGRCDCLVIDEKIPASNGLHLITELRERDFSTPAILVTSQPSMSLRDEAEKAGVPIVEKPLLGNGLLDTIRDAIGGSSGLA